MVAVQVYVVRGHAAGYMHAHTHTKTFPPHTHAHTHSVQVYIVRDPAAGVPELKMSGAALDQARRAYGTDEDCLVVNLPSRKAEEGAPVGKFYEACARGGGRGGGGEPEVASAAHLCGGR
jgi:hypothetical protein